jgi:O-succinylbenzoate synthase
MKLVGIELWRVDLALSNPVATSQGSHGPRPVLYVRVVTDEAEGWGECGALPGGTAVDPALDDVDVAVAERAVPRLFQAGASRGGELVGAPSVARLFGEGPLERVVAATIEMAVLDAELRSSATALAERLGAVRAVVESGGVVGIPPGRDPGALVDAAARLLDGGARRVRFKIEPGWDTVPARALRTAFPSAALLADANGAYRRGGTDDDASVLCALDDYGLVCIEQPLPAPDLAALGILAAELATPIGLDESLGTVRRLAEAIRYGAVAVACIKPSRIGGLLAARRALAMAAEAGIDGFVGGFFESGLGRAANAAVAGLCGSSLPGDLSDPADYLVEDPCGYLEVDGGAVRLTTAPGVGAAPDSAVLARLGAVGRWFPYRS